MNITVSDQLYIFSLCIACGAAMGAIFDLFRVSRRLIRTGYKASAAEDIAFWTITAFVFFLFVLGVNSGEIRFYIYMGAFAGAALYFLILSRYVLKVSVFAAGIIIKVCAFVIKIVMKPVMFVFKLLRKPLFLVIGMGRRSGGRIKRRLSLAMFNFTKFLRKI
ncbi:MAG: Spore protein YabQ [Firmicutes bacterium ADurb.Bin193]|nr:MAG: Spore protein YabQ [Firmicutes bacterium ADurb.Bin193]